MNKPFLLMAKTPPTHFGFVAVGQWGRCLYGAMLPLWKVCTV